MRSATVGIGVFCLTAFAAAGALSPGMQPDEAGRSRELGLPFFDIFNPRDYRGHFQVWTAVQDAAGLIYFGNYGRVLVYDGARWDRIEVPGTTFVRGLAIDHDDVVWIAAVNELGYAATDATGRRTFVSLRDQLPVEARECGELFRVVLTPQGPIFQSRTWLLRWNGTAFATLALPAPNLWQLAAAGDTLWVTDDQRGWFTVTEEENKLVLSPRPRPVVCEGNALTFAMAGDSPGEFIFGSTRRGLIRWDGANFTPFPTEVDEILKQKRLYRGTRLTDGRIALTTLQAGAYLLDAGGRLLAALDEEARMPDNAAIFPLQARDGSLWICLQRGMVRVDARPWLTWFGPARGAPSSRMQPPVRYRGDLYTCSNSGLMRLTPAAAEVPARLTPVPDVPDFLAGLVVVDDALICLGDGGIFEWRGDKAKPLPGQPVNAFMFIEATGQPGRWFAILSGAVTSYRREAGEWIFEGAIPELTNVRSVVAMPDGTWWMGTLSDGVWRVTFPAPSATGPGKPAITRFAGGRGLPVGHGWARVSLDGGRPLVRCELGLFRFDEVAGRFAPTTEFGARFADGTATSGPTNSDDPHDGTWLSARRAGEATLMTETELGVHGSSGWRTLYIPQLARLDDVSDLAYERKDDALWIAVHAGLVRVDLAQWRTAPPLRDPVVILRDVQTTDGTRLSAKGSWRLPYSRRLLHLSFATPSFSGDPAGIYESTLVGDGDPIVLADGNPQREFSALASGDYTLRVRSRRGDGRWSTPLELAFTILPPWWRSGWAWSAYALFGALAIFGLVRSRTQAAHRRADRLEAVVAARTEDLRRSNVELARLHQLELDEKIAAKLAEEKARLELLRYQLNPHFLLNSFTALRGLVFSRPEAAGEMVAKLGEFCRMALTRTDESGGTVADEAKLIETYLATEKARWRDELVCSLECDPAIAGVRLPPFLLQPLVENAVKYGGRTSPERLEVTVRIVGDGGGLRIEVANTGEWVGEGDSHRQGSTGIGLDNLRQRLRRYYPEAHAIDVQSSAGWVRVVLRLQRPARDPFTPSHAGY